nr:immunoglobulin light chain junction region [Macaca mulatta]
CMQTLEFPRTF